MEGNNELCVTGAKMVVKGKRGDESTESGGVYDKE